ncbi:MAG: hypothetical protein ACOC1P_03155 [Minisyncoccales bacterium]
MRKKDINGIINDLLCLNDYKNPLELFFIDKKVEVDLINGEISGIERDSLWEFHKEKIKWFKKRVNELNGNLEDFQEAKIFVHGAIEKIVIIFKGKKFTKQRFYNQKKSYFLTRKQIEELEPDVDLSDNKNKNL